MDLADAVEAYWLELVPLLPSPDRPGKAVDQVKVSIFILSLTSTSSNANGSSRSQRTIQRSTQSMHPVHRPHPTRHLRLLRRHGWADSSPIRRPRASRHSPRGSVVLYSRCAASPCCPPNLSLC